MRLSKETRQKLQTFFRLYFNDENLKLPKVEIYIGSGAKLVTKIIRVDGITIGRHVFINPGLAKYRNKKLLVPKELLAHEIAHVIQYQKAGFWKFLYRYIKDYFAILKGKKSRRAPARMESYWKIPDEIEARDAARKFVEWLEERNRNLS